MGREPHFKMVSASMCRGRKHALKMESLNLLIWQVSSSIVAEKAHYQMKASEDSYACQSVEAERAHSSQSYSVCIGIERTLESLSKRRAAQESILKIAHLLQKAHLYHDQASEPRSFQRWLSSENSVQLNLC